MPRQNVIMKDLTLEVGYVSGHQLGLHVSGRHRLHIRPAKLYDSAHGPQGTVDHLGVVTSGKALYPKHRLKGLFAFGYQQNY